MRYTQTKRPHRRQIDMLVPARFPRALFWLSLVTFVLMSGCRSAEVQSASKPAGVPVTVGVVTKEQVPQEVHAVGTVEASAVIQVKSQVGGELVRVAFAEGAEVRKGELLFEIDPRPYEQAVRQAEATLARDEAAAKQAQANLERDLAQAKSLEADAARYQQLAKEGVISRSQNDQTTAAAEANRASANADRAAIESAKASIESDRAALDRAKLDLSYCQIHAPVAGRVGNLLVHPGNLIAANTQALVTIHQIEPIWVSFGVPEEYLTAVRRNSASRQLPVQVAPQDNPTQKVNGALTVIDNTVDLSTGTIKLKATFTNTNRALWPGQFVNATLTLDTLHDVIVVPSEAVQPSQNGQLVYVVKSDQTVEARPVTTGSVAGNKTIVEKGLSPGETVVTDGQLRLFPGATIQPVAAPKANL